jgi:mannose-6-phosphate isomerase-like protein (cupin superfamily)
MQIISRAGEYTAPSGDAGTHWIEHLRSADLSVGTYSIRTGGVDGQSPHTEDEIYVIARGRATIVTESTSVAVRAGDTIFVPAFEAHRFVDVTDDLAVLVIFAPAEGSRAPSDTNS